MIRGLGIGMRTPLVPALLKTERTVDFLEIIPENFVGRGGKAVRDLLRCAERWPILAHGVGASIGGPDPLNRDYLSGLKELLDTLEVPFYTDHLCFSSVGGFQTHGLLPLPETDEAVLHCARRIEVVRDLLDRPVAVENIAQYADMPTRTMGREVFVAEVCREADCGLLLDVNNVVVNARNRGNDPAHDLALLPIERTMQMHVAGHEMRGTRCLDSHGAPVDSVVSGLARDVLKSLDHSVPVLLERDLNIPPLDQVLDEADGLRTLLFGDA